MLPLFYALLVLIAVFLLLCSIMVTAILKSSHTPIIVTILSIASIVSFMIGLISQTFLIKSLDEYLDISSDSLLLNINAYSQTLSWIFGHMFLYLLFIRNIRNTFRNTMFEASQSSLLIIYLLLILFFISGFSGAVIYALYYEWFITADQYSIISPITILIMESIDILLSTVLSYMFISRLFKLHKAYINNQHQGQILFAAFRYFIIALISFISCQLFLLAYTNNSFAFTAAFGYYKWSLVIYLYSFAIDCIISSFCVYLNWNEKSIFLQLCVACCLDMQPENDAMVVNNSSNVIHHGHDTRTVLLQESSTTIHNDSRMRSLPNEGLTVTFTDDKSVTSIKGNVHVTKQQSISYQNNEQQNEYPFISGHLHITDR
eukprot:405668_1